MLLKSFTPPVYFQSPISEKHYIIVDGKWNEVTRSYTMTELMEIWEKVTYTKTESTSINKRSYEVHGSKGNVYEVSIVNGIWGCTCPAHSFKRYVDCKHITQIKNQIK